MQATRLLIRKPRHASDRWRHHPINGPFLCDASGTGSDFRMGRTFAVERDWIKRYETGTHVKPAEYGIECQPVVERETKRSRSQLLSLEPADFLNRSQVHADQAREKHDRRALER